MPFLYFLNTVSVSFPGCLVKTLVYSGCSIFLDETSQKWMLPLSPKIQIIYLLSCLLCPYNLFMVVKAHKYVSVLYKNNDERNVQYLCSRAKEVTNLKKKQFSQEFSPVTGHYNLQRRTVTCVLEW